ncbi:MAG: cell division protein ZapE [Alphaproteobacteria bacterium]|nr:MAG: cell division protein ZapE [Alphaproteobacteria bacterium]
MRVERAQFTGLYGYRQKNLAQVTGFCYETPDGSIYRVFQLTIISTYRDLVHQGAVLQDPAQELAVEKLQLLAQRLQGYRPGKRRRLFGRAEPEPEGLYIYGDVGRGKSMLMDLFFDLAPQEKKRRVHFHAFMLEVHDEIFRWRKLSETERRGEPFHVKGAGDDPIPPVAQKIASEAVLLCFDEFQVSDVADAMILGRLFEALFERGVIVVATSNRDPWSLYQGGLNRALFEPFIAMIAEKLDVHHLDSPKDYRLERLKGAPVYHFPLGAAADQALQEAFRQLTDGAVGSPFALEVKGRKVILPRTAKGVAMASFEALCGAALGAGDYLALAGAFDTLILAGIPALGPENRNEAKRFVTLIDALYESHTKLIASADVPVEQLYLTGDGSFEFARTVSRLIEMQSVEYWEG